MGQLVLAMNGRSVRLNRAELMKLGLISVAPRRRLGGWQDKPTLRLDAAAYKAYALGFSWHPAEHAELLGIERGGDWGDEGYDLADA